MSYAITAVAMSLAKVKRAVGSKDAALLKTIATEFKSLLAQSEQDVDRDEGEISLKEAIKHLVMGEKLRETCGCQYGYGLEILCKHFGDTLSNSEWLDMRWAYVERVDAALKNAGVNDKEFTIAKRLLGRGPPLPLPEINDFPLIGYYLEPEIARVAADLRRSVPKIQDKEITESLAQVQSWFDTCMRAHNDLVCFYQ